MKNRFKQINRSVLEGTLSPDNYSGFKPGDRVTSRYYGTGVYEVEDVRYINTPSSALYYVFARNLESGMRISRYPEELQKIQK